MWTRSQQSIPGLDEAGAQSAERPDDDLQRKAAQGQRDQHERDGRTGPAPVGAGERATRSHDVVAAEHGDGEEGKHEGADEPAAARRRDDRTEGAGEPFGGPPGGGADTHRPPSMRATAVHLNPRDPP